MFVAKSIRDDFKKILILMFLFIAFNCRAEKNVIYTIEDDDLTEIKDVNILLILSRDASYKSFLDLKCTLVGKKILLSIRPDVQTYFLTTADSCGWGASLGPIWIISKEKNDTNILFRGGGYALIRLRAFTKNMYDIEISIDNKYKLYKFNGNNYD